VLRRAGLVLQARQARGEPAAEGRVDAVPLGGQVGSNALDGPALEVQTHDGEAALDRVGDVAIAREAPRGGAGRHPGGQEALDTVLAHRPAEALRADGGDLVRKLLNGRTAVPRVLITDTLASHGAARRAILPSIGQQRQKRPNNRAGNAHQPTRERERQMRRFTSPGHAQRATASPPGTIRPRHMIRALPIFW